MIGVKNVLLDCDGRVESKQFVVLSKGYTVTIPTHLRYELESGQEVIIYPEFEAIVIKKKEFESIENQAIVGRYGSLYIPKEIRKFKNLLPGTKFLIIGEQEGQSIRLIPCS